MHAAGVRYLGTDALVPSSLLPDGWRQRFGTGCGCHGVQRHQGRRMAVVVTIRVGSSAAIAYRSRRVADRSGRRDRGRRAGAGGRRPSAPPSTVLWRQAGRWQQRRAARWWPQRLAAARGALPWSIILTFVFWTRAPSPKGAPCPRGYKGDLPHAPPADPPHRKINGLRVSLPHLSRASRRLPALSDFNGLQMTLRTL